MATAMKCYSQLVNFSYLKETTGPSCILGNVTAIDIQDGASEVILQDFFSWEYCS